MADFNSQYKSDLLKIRRLSENNSRLFSGSDSGSSAIIENKNSSFDAAKVPGSKDKQRRSKFENLRKKYEPHYPGKTEKREDINNYLNPYIINERGGGMGRKKELQKEEDEKFDLEKKSELERARNSSKITQDRKMANRLKNLAKVATPWGAASLLKYINWSKDWLYILALFFAIAKDFVDVVGIGSLPALGTVVSICCSIMIFLLILLAEGSSKRRYVKKTVNKYIVLIGGTLVEAFFFGLNLFPIEAITLIVVYIMVLFERKQEKEAEKKKEN